MDRASLRAIPTSADVRSRLIAAARRLVPAKLRRARSELIHALRRDEAHYEMVERRDFMRRAFRALAFNGIGGDYAEFGCCGGQTFGLGYWAMQRAGFRGRLWAFDSFRGLPPQAGSDDGHPMWVGGTMAISVDAFRRVCRTYGMADSDYRVVEGFYAESLADPDRNRRDLPQDIALAYVDCDLYSSAAEVLRFLGTRLKHGMIVAFDDYYCWSGTAVSGERNACNEFFADHPEFRLLPYLPFGWHGMSFVIEDKSLLRRSEAGVHY